jgi:hypothetical protein
MDLPLIHKLIEVYKIWHEYLPHFPKTSRYTLGSKIDTLLVQTAEHVFCACYLHGELKLEHIEKAITELDLSKFFLRISWEIKALDNKKYTILSENLDEVGRMLGGWARQQKEKAPLAF